jgi:large repetitive protein
VLTNDTLGGQPVSEGADCNVQLTPGASPNPNLVMNADGTISIAAGTPAGT